VLSLANIPEPPIAAEATRTAAANKFVLWTNVQNLSLLGSDAAFYLDPRYPHRCGMPAMSSVNFRPKQHVLITEKVSTRFDLKRFPDALLSSRSLVRIQPGSPTPLYFNS
jgi:hypothetical protein